MGWRCGCHPSKAPLFDSVAPLGPAEDWHVQISTLSWGSPPPYSSLLLASPYRGCQTPLDPVSSIAQVAWRASQQAVMYSSLLMLGCRSYS